MTPAEQYLRARDEALDALVHAVRMLGQLDPDDQAHLGWELLDTLDTYEGFIERVVAGGRVP